MSEHKHEWRGYGASGLVCDACNLFIDGRYVSDLEDRAERAEADVESLRVIEQSYIRAVVGSVEERERSEAALREALRRFREAADRLAPIRPTVEEMESVGLPEIAAFWEAYDALAALDKERGR